MYRQQHRKDKLLVVGISPQPRRFVQNTPQSCVVYPACPEVLCCAAGGAPFTHTGLPQGSWSQCRWCSC